MKATIEAKSTAGIVFEVSTKEFVGSKGAADECDKSSAIISEIFRDNCIEVVKWWAYAAEGIN